VPGRAGAGRRRDGGLGRCVDWRSWTGRKTPSGFPGALAAHAVIRCGNPSSARAVSNRVVLAPSMRDAAVKRAGSDTRQHEHDRIFHTGAPLHGSDAARDASPLRIPLLVLTTYIAAQQPRGFVNIRREPAPQSAIESLSLKVKRAGCFGHWQLTDRPLLGTGPASKWHIWSLVRNSPSVSMFESCQFDSIHELSVPSHALNFTY
jgi:hypothetical protein